MEEKDQLKEILININQINEPIDLEVGIMHAIREQEIIKNQIIRYRRNGIRGFVFCLILVITLAFMYSFSNGFQTFEGASIKYTSIIISLIILFAQLEMGGLQFINQYQFKNNKS